MTINNVTFNFLDKYYPFYDWLNSDEIVTKKCYVYKVDTSIINAFIEYNIILDKLLLKNMPIVFCDDYTAIGIMFNSDGESKSKSSINLCDEERILNYTRFMKKEKVIYKKLCKQTMYDTLRFDENIRNNLLIEIDGLIKNNDVEKLKFIHYELFNKDEINFEFMKKNIIKKLNGPISDLEKNVYNLLKICYKTV